ncbi:hypothetical protein BDB01DRAFT_903915 [Pilobolus umbonatus]|nr:hypothetical protein BDB01DRAFT_903915 [Pilobolus umbonatus]
MKFIIAYIVCVLVVIVTSEVADSVINEVTSKNQASPLESIWVSVRQKLGYGTTANSVEEKPELQQPQQVYDSANKLASQMAPIERPLLFINPKLDERWILGEEGSIKWAISNYIGNSADNVKMNCNLYHGGKMILSVFKDVPLSIGTESWTPPSFLEASPNYNFRLWSQPSNIGLIDAYSPTFSIVPRQEDAYMFTNNKGMVQGDLENGTDSSSGNTPPVLRIGHPNVPGQHGVLVSKNTTNVDDTISPTGIYALYPSAEFRLSPNFNCIMLLLPLIYAIY